MMEASCELHSAGRDRPPACANGPPYLSSQSLLCLRSSNFSLAIHSLSSTQREGRAHGLGDPQPLTRSERIDIQFAGHQEFEERLFLEPAGLGDAEQQQVLVTGSSKKVPEIFRWTARWRMPRSAVLLFQGMPSRDRNVNSESRYRSNRF